MALKDSIKLQPHQQEALEKSRKGTGLLINHGLGSGKTLTSMAIAEDAGGPALVVVPASLQANYKEQLERFVTPDRVDDYHIVSYDKFRNNPDKFLALEPNILIADEVHRLRNPGANRSAMEYARGQVPQMLGMTASLASNDPSEAVPLVNLVAGKRVVSQRKFQKDYIEEVPAGVSFAARLWGAEPGLVPRVINKPKLKKTLGPYIHRYTGSEEYKKNLPGRLDELVEVPMSKKQKDMYEGIIDKSPALAYKIRHNLPPSKKELTQLNAFQIAARQIMNSPTQYEAGNNDPVKTSPKMQRVLADVHELAKDDPNFRAVIYSSFLDAGTRPVLEASTLQSGLYEGALTQRDRKDVLNRYASGEAPLLGISPAGAEGLDLKGTKLMAVLEEHWNPEQTNQAIGRAIRYKSHEHLPADERYVKVRKYRSVYPDRWYHRLVEKPKTIDEYIAARAGEKEQFNNDFLSVFDAPTKRLRRKTSGASMGLRSKTAFLGANGPFNPIDDGQETMLGSFGLGMAGTGAGAMAASVDPLLGNRTAYVGVNNPKIREYLLRTGLSDDPAVATLLDKAKSPLLLTQDWRDAHAAGLVNDDILKKNPISAAVAMATGMKGHDRSVKQAPELSNVLRLELPEHVYQKALQSAPVAPGLDFRDIGGKLDVDAGDIEPWKLNTLFRRVRELPINIKANPLRTLKGVGLLGAGAAGLAAGGWLASRNFKRDSAAENLLERIQGLSTLLK